MPTFGLEALGIVATSAKAPARTANSIPQLQNAVTVSEYEAAAIKLANASLYKAASRQRKPHKPHTQPQLQTTISVGSAAAAHLAAAKVLSSLQAEATPDLYPTADHRLSRCNLVASRGSSLLRVTSTSVIC